MLSTNAELIELVKLPLLVEHFKEHKQWDLKISFFGFVYMHYLEDDSKYGDQARDMQMPFKTSCHSSITLVGLMVTALDFAIVPKSTFKERKQKLIAGSTAFSSQYLSSIWQPPRSC
jgi:hypothetical protein